MDRTRKVQIGLTIVGFTMLFVNHYSFTYPCVSSRKSGSGGAVSLQEFRNNKGSLFGDVLPLSKPSVVCDKYSIIPNGIEQKRMSKANQYRLVPDVFILLAYFAIFYFASSFKEARK